MKLFKRLLPLCLLFVSSTFELFAQNNVGVGTITPAYKLDVVGRARVQAGVLNSVGTSAGIWFTDYRANTDIVFAGMADSVNYGLYSNRPGRGWEFYFDAKYGNIGIGRKPGAGATRLFLDHPGGAAIALYNNGDYRGGMQATDSTLEIYSARSGPIIGDPTRDIIFWPPPPPCAGICPIAGSAGRTAFYTNAPNARVHFTVSTGTSGVLIGSASAVPAIGYMLSVDGKIICEELKVQLNTAWPDYVFEDDYKMPTLASLEEKVMREKHLPGIPAASEVAENKGVEIGAVQQKMLEKIEELYRYLFEMDKENKQLKSEMDLLKKQAQTPK
jgi:hypothetical protein